MATLSELKELAQKRREANPEAAQLRQRLAKLIVKNEIKKLIQNAAWPTQSEAAKFLDIHRGTICRAIAEGKLETNGLKGRLCQIDPVSLLKFHKEREQRENAKIERKIPD